MAAHWSRRTYRTQDYCKQKSAHWNFIFQKRNSKGRKGIRNNARPRVSLTQIIHRAQIRSSFINMFNSALVNNSTVKELARSGAAPSKSGPGASKTDDVAIVNDVRNIVTTTKPHKAGAWRPTCTETMCVYTMSTGRMMEGSVYTPSRSCLKAWKCTERHVQQSLETGHAKNKLLTERPDFVLWWGKRN